MHVSIRNCYRTAPLYYMPIGAIRAGHLLAVMRERNLDRSARAHTIGGPCNGGSACTMRLRGCGCPL